jgi:hypothetical protein
MLDWRQKFRDCGWNPSTVTEGSDSLAFFNKDGLVGYFVYVPNRHIVSVQRNTHQVPHFKNRWQISCCRDLKTGLDKWAYWDGHEAHDQILDDVPIRITLITLQMQAEMEKLLNDS